MKAAYAFAELSSARRKQVGAVLVSAKGYGIIAEGYNGTPSGFDNNCEVPADHVWDFQVFPPKHFCKVCDYTSSDILNANWPSCSALVTKPEVLHAESNAITKVARSTSSSSGATIYVTCSPCVECAKLIIQAGIKRVVYDEVYRNIDGLDLLARAKIVVDELGLIRKDTCDLELQDEGLCDPNDQRGHGASA